MYESGARWEQQRGTMAEFFGEVKLGGSQGRYGIVPERPCPKGGRGRTGKLPSLPTTSPPSFSLGARHVDGVSGSVKRKQNGTEELEGGFRPHQAGPYLSP